ncbi:MAG: hypothetical protein ACRENP_04420 [Longimicrobiales bacterium]
MAAIIGQNWRGGQATRLEALTDSVSSSGEWAGITHSNGSHLSQQWKPAPQCIHHDNSL